jgi:hypothetical protein
MTPAALHTRLQTLHTDLEEICDCPQAVAVNWSIIAGAMADLSQELKTAVEEPLSYRVFAQHAATVLEGGCQALDLTCNSDDEAEQTNIIAVIACAIAGLLRTVTSRFCHEVPAND